MKQKIVFAIVIALLFNIRYLAAQGIIPLYTDSIPGSRVVLSKDNSPDLTIFKPVKATGTAVLVIPGGGYSFLATPTEGTAIAEAFAKQGVTAFVLKYRLPSDGTMKNKSIGPLQDAQQAMLIIRSKAKEFGIDEKKLGVVGFSAGGHLASTLETKFETSYVSNPNKIPLRPDFAILVYPVISMKEGLAHQGSKEALLGKSANQDLIQQFSNEEQVTEKTPPTYITHTADDQIVTVNNSLEMYKALIVKKVPAELHLYPKGNHGFIQRLPDYEWLNPILMFMKRQGMFDGEIKGRDQNNPEVLSKELKAMQQAGKKDEAAVLAQNYINKIKTADVFKRENLQFIVDFTTSSKQKGFEIIYKNRIKIDTLLDTKWSPASYAIRRIIKNEEVAQVLKEGITNAELSKLKSDVQKKYGLMGKEAYDSSLLIYAADNKKWDLYEDAYISYYSTALSRPEYNINNDAMLVFENINRIKVLKVAIKAMEYNLKYYQPQGTEFYASAIDTYANLLYKIGRKEEGIKWQEKAVAASNRKNSVLIANLEKMKKGERTW